MCVAVESYLLKQKSYKLYSINYQQIEKKLNSKYQRKNFEKRNYQKKKRLLLFFQIQLKLVPKE